MTADNAESPSDLRPIRSVSSVVLLPPPSAVFSCRPLLPLCAAGVPLARLPQRPFNLLRSLRELTHLDRKSVV